MSMPLDKWESLMAQVKGSVERDILRAPLVLDLNGTGKNWWEAVA